MNEQLTDWRLNGDFWMLFYELLAVFTRRLEGRLQIVAQLVRFIRESCPGCMITPRERCDSCLRSGPTLGRKLWYYIFLAGCSFEEYIQHPAARRRAISHIKKAKKSHDSVVVQICENHCEPFFYGKVPPHAFNVGMFTIFEFFK